MRKSGQVARSCQSVLDWSRNRLQGRRQRANASASWVHLFHVAELETGETRISARDLERCFREKLDVLTGFISAGLSASAPRLSARRRQDRLRAGQHYLPT